MTPIESEIGDYLQWMAVHNYASTTITEMLTAYQQQLFSHRKRNGAPLSVATQAQRLVPVVQFLGWLRREQRIETNPAADLLMPRPDRKLPEATLSAAEMSALVGAPDIARPLGLRDRAVLEVFYSCGLRRGELISLGLLDLDFGRGTVFVRSGKGAKDRYVPIGERALFWVRLYVELARPLLVQDRPTDCLFLSSAGTPLCPDWLCRQVRRYLAEGGIEKRGSCHLLRHSVATLMMEGGADIRFVAELLGHARLETTQRYTHVSSKGSELSTPPPIRLPAWTLPWQPNFVPRCPE